MVFVAQFRGIALLVVTMTASWNVASFSMAQSLFPMCRDEKWGYMRASGEIVIAPKFQRASDFRGGLARVIHDRQFAFVTPTGDVAFVLPVDVVSVGDFSEGLAWFKSSGYGYIDRDGRVAIEPKYANAKDFQHGVTPVCILDEKTGSERWGFVRKNGKWLVEPQFKYADGFTEGVATVADSDSPSQYFIDMKGDRAFDIEVPKGLWIGGLSQFSGGLAKVLYYSEGDGKPRAGYIDHFGQLYIQPVYAGGGVFREGLAVVIAEGHVAAIDGSGKTAFTTTFLQGGKFSEGLCRVRSRAGSWAYIDGTGAAVIRKATGSEWPGGVEFNDCEDFINGLARVHIGGEFEITNDGPVAWKRGGWYYMGRDGGIVALCRLDSDIGESYGREAR